jgi:hypothetical protein
LAWFSEFSTFRQLTLDMGVFIDIMGSPDCNYIKIAMGEVDFLGYLIHPLFFGVLGAWMT